MHISYSFSKLAIRYLRRIGVPLLVCMSLNTSAGGIDHVDRELEDIREQLNDWLKGRTTEQVEQRVERNVRARVRQSIEQTVTENIANSVADSALQSLETALPGRPDITPTEVKQIDSASAKLKSDTVQPELDALIASQLSRIEREVDLVLDTVQDKEGNSALANEWLVMTDRTTLDHLESEGYLISHLEELSGLGYLLGRLKAPETFEPGEITTVHVLDSP